MDAVVVLSAEKEIPVIHVPSDATLVIHDLAVSRHSDEAAFGFLEVLLVREGQDSPLLLLCLDREPRRHFSLRIKVLWLLRDRGTSKSSGNDHTENQN